MTALFPLGQLTATPGALEALQAAQSDPMSLLGRHVSGDWGTISPDDAAENRRSVRDGFRILSSYVLKTGERIWIITEWDRSLTTILTPSEY